METVGKFMGESRFTWLGRNVEVLLVGQSPSVTRLVGR